MSNEFADTITWAADGHGFIVKNIQHFEKTVLPKFFKHNKFSSFIRQLNMYDFHKIRHKGDQKEFKHIFFCKDQPELLCQIKRKTPDQVEANDKKLKEALTIADKWKKLEGQIDILDSDNSQCGDGEPSPKVGGANSQLMNQEFTSNKESSDLMMCLMLYNKALSKNSNSNVTNMILNKTQDYINSIKSILDIKESKTSTTLPDCSEETCSLGKKSFHECAGNDPEFENYCVQKKLKTCDDFALKREDSYASKTLHCGDVENYGCQNIFQSDEPEIEHFYKYSGWENFQLSLGDISGTDTELYHAFF